MFKLSQFQKFAKMVTNRSCFEKNEKAQNVAKEF